MLPRRWRRRPAPRRRCRVSRPAGCAQRGLVGALAGLVGGELLGAGDFAEGGVVGELGLVAGRLDVVLAGEQDEQRADFEVAEAGELGEPAAQVGAGLGLVPDAGGVAVVAFLQEGAEGL